MSYSSTNDRRKGASITRVLSATTIGTVIEWYDFYAYGAAAALIFNTQFFPQMSKIDGLLASFATFAVGFFARPLGGIFFGNLGDKKGRKPALIGAMMLMGLASGLIGFLPNFSQIGIWAPILLVILRVLQGLGAGAEYAGAAVTGVEYAREGRSGLLGAFPASGVMIASILYSAVFSLVSSFMSKSSFLIWGWRIPFFIGFGTLIVAIWIRLKMDETPVFTSAENTRTEARVPALEVIRKYPWRVLLATGAMLNGVHSYTLLVFVLSYLTNTLGMPKSIGLYGTLLMNIVGLFTVLIFGALSDRIGRKPLYIGGAIFTGVFAFPMFWMLNTKSTVLILLAMIIAYAIGVNSMWGPQGAFLSEIFPAEVRYSGLAIAREVGGAISGGTAPFVATWLVAKSGGQTWSISLYMLVVGLIVALSAYLLPETMRGKHVQNIKPKSTGIDA